jgi:hypothetical protein
MIYSGRIPYGTNQVESSSLAITVENTDVAVFTTGSLLVSGSLTSLGGFTGSFSGSFTGSANFTTLTSSNALITGNVIVLGTASINTLVINQTQLSTGSNQLGDNADDFQTLFGTVRIPTGSFTVTGSSFMTGSLTVTGGITGSLFGTSSLALTASYVNPLTQNLTLTGSFNINTPSVTGTRERLLTATVSDATGDFFFINNGTIGEGNFAPVFGGITTTSQNLWGLGFNGFTTVADDVNVSSYGLIDFVALRTTNPTDPSNGTLSNVTTRKLFTFRGLTNNNYITVFAGGNVNIGGANPTDAGFKLDVNGTGRFSGNVQITGSASNSLLVKGSGTTSSTTSLRVENSAATARLTILDDGTSAFNTNHLYISSSGNIGIGTSTPNFRLDVSGSSEFVGNVQITGSTFISASAGTGSALTVYKSGSTVVSIQGSQGELFSITDSLSGSLFSVSNISGLPILEVFSDNTTLVGNYLDPMLVTTQLVTANSGSTTVYSLPTASYDGAFYDYVIRSGSNSRAGQIMAIWSGSSVNYTDNSTTDFGSTANLSFNVIVSGSNMVLRSTVTTGSWTVKTIIRSI